MARNPIVFQNGTLVSNAKVEVGGTIYDVTPAEYEGTTPLSANNLNQLQTNLYDYVDEENLIIYSLNETLTKKRWIDGRPIYRKVIDMGNLNNATNKAVSHGITNLDFMTHASGFAYSTQVQITHAGFNDEIYWNKTYMTWNTKSDRRNFVAYVICEYVKTSDL